MRGRIRFGIIGLGGISRAHAGGYTKAQDQADIVAVCDVNEDAAHSRASELGCEAYTEYEALLRNPNVEAVDVTVPHAMHYPVTLAALRAGKHVLVEKPMAGTAEQCRELVTLAASRDLTFTVAENTRFVTAYVEAEKLVRSGAIGDPRLIRTFIYGSEYGKLTNPTSWLRSKDASLGGVILDCGAHSFYLLKWFFGPIAQVQAFQSTFVEGSEVEDHAIVNGRMENGALFSTEYTATAEIPWGERCEIYGSRGSIIIDQMNNPPALLYRGATDFDPVPVEGVPFDPEGWKWASIAAEVVDFIDALYEGRRPTIDSTDGWYAVHVVERAYQSVTRQGAMVRVDNMLDVTAPVGAG